MAFWDGLLGKKKHSFQKTEYVPVDAQAEAEETEFLRKHQLSNASLREKFIVRMLEQMKEASDEMDSLHREYDTITSHLTDMEEVERLPEHMSAPIKDLATKILRLESEHKSYRANENHMSEAEYSWGEKIDPMMPEAYEKLCQAEELQKAIRSDLGRMEGEKQAYYYRRNELADMQANLKGIVVITLIAVLVCIVVLLIMQFGFELDAYIGYILTFLGAAVAFTFLFVKNMDLRKEARVVEKTICKLIQMHNSIKIRYVNNTNLLDYLYLKYEVNSSKEMNQRFDAFCKEKAEREKFERAKSDIAMYRRELVQLLRPLPIVTPNLWIYQVEALVNHNEMVEIRHGLITQRQNLRKQIEYNRDIALFAKSELEGLVRDYPQYSAEVLGRMEQYEMKTVIK